MGCAKLPMRSTPNAKIGGSRAKITPPLRKAEMSFRILIQNRRHKITVLRTSATQYPRNPIEIIHSNRDGQTGLGRIRH